VDPSGKSAKQGIRCEIKASCKVFKEAKEKFKAEQGRAA
jgi:hypothetical protein